MLQFLAHYEYDFDIIFLMEFFACCGNYCNKGKKYEIEINTERKGREEEKHTGSWFRSQEG